MCLYSGWGRKRESLHEFMTMFETGKADIPWFICPAVEKRITVFPRTSACRWALLQCAVDGHSCILIKFLQA